MNNAVIDCPGCNGHGKQRDIKDLDPVEGYKLAPYYKCFMCKGEGVIIPNNNKRYTACVAYWEVYNKFLDDEAKKENHDRLNKAKLIKQAKSKLSKDELKALGVK